MDAVTDINIAAELAANDNEMESEWVEYDWGDGYRFQGSIIRPNPHAL